jgi:uncharacterized protein (DUF1697 family)
MAGRFAALLRGVNVGKAKRVPMAELRALLEKQGYREVRTLLNSGNAVFTATKSPGTLAAAVERGIFEHFGFSCRVSVLSAEEISEIIDANPLGKLADNPSRLMVSVLLDPAQRKKLVPLTREKWHPEALGLGDRASYLWCPDGVIDSKVFKAIDKAMGDGITTRNWATMLKLHAMLGGG